MNNMRQKGQTAKYYGLANKGATCYLNSVLQVLFMTKDFREKITSYSHTPPPTGKKHIDSELRNLFRDLEKHSADTSDIIGKLSIRNVFEPHDAAEYYEKILRFTRPEASQIFHGKLINRTRCCGCGKGPEMEARFWSLPLSLVTNCNEYSVENGIKDFFCSTKISGDNQMYCETCDDKRDADLESEMKDYPQVLVLLLKRFEMNFEYNVWTKINCSVKISECLTFQDNQKYKLCAYVEHFGDLQSGHYKATIKSQDDDEWYIFDDLNVQKSNYHHFQLDPTELSRNVYLLFYQKQKEEEVQTKELKEYLTIENNDEPSEAKKRKSCEERNQKQWENNSICENSNYFVFPNNREIRQNKTSKKSQPEGSHYNETEPRENRKLGCDGFHREANEPSEDAVWRQPLSRNGKIVNDSIPFMEQREHQADRQSTKQAGNPYEENRSSKPTWNTQHLNQKRWTKNSPGDDHKYRYRPVQRSHSFVQGTGPYITQSNQQFHQWRPRDSRERRGGSLNRSGHPLEFGAGPGPGSPRGSEKKCYYMLSQDNQLETFGNEIHGNRMTNEGWKKNGAREAEKYSHNVRAERPPPVQHYNRESEQKYEINSQQCLERSKKWTGRGYDANGTDRREVQTDRRGEAKTDGRGEVKTDRRGKAKTDRRGEVKTDRRGEAETDRRGEDKTDRRGEAKTDRRGEVKTDRRGEVKTDRRGEVKTDRRGEVKTDRRGEVKTNRREAKTTQQQAKGNESFRKKSPKNENAAVVEGVNNLSLHDHPDTIIQVNLEVLETNDEPRRKKIFCFGCIPFPKLNVLETNDEPKKKKKYCPCPKFLKRIKRRKHK